MGRLAAIAFLLGLWGLSAVAGERTTAFVGGTLIDGAGSAPIPNAALLVRGERILAAGPVATVPVPADAVVVDTTGRWIIPGLIDAHVHFFQSGGLYTRPDIIDLRAPPLCGGGRGRSGKLARNPGPLSRERDHQRRRSRRSALELRGARARPDHAHRAARRRGGPAACDLRADRTCGAGRTSHGPGPDTRTSDSRGGSATPAYARPGQDLVRPSRPGPRPRARLDRAAIATSQAAGVRVVVHATQARVARAVIEAGADILAHSIDEGSIDDGLLAAMKARDVIYITTLSVSRGYQAVLGRHVALNPIERRLGDPKAIASFDDLDTMPRDLVPAWVRLRPRQPLDPVAAGNLRRLHAHGVRVAAGSDAGNIGTLHGPALHRELELMVEAGLTPMQVMTAATQGGAAVMGRSGDLGTLAPGKLADFVVLDADPLADIRNTQRIHRVVKGGEMFDPAVVIK